MKTLLLLTLLILCGTPLALYADENASVLRVIDGDTIVVRIGNVIEHVRLIGINAPELKDRSTGVAQCYAREARNELRRFLNHSPIILARDPRTKNRDVYGRLLRIITSQRSSSVSVNISLVKTGFARATTRFDFVQREQFLQEEKKAQAQRAGLWGACGKNYGKYLRGSTGRPLERTSK